MDGEWNEVKAKPKMKKKEAPKVNQIQYGGKGAHGKLIAGPIKQGQMSNAPSQYQALNNQASTIAEYNFNIEDDDFEAPTKKIELTSHKCAQAVSEARLKAGLTQTQLAQKVGIKNSLLVDIENCTA